MKKSAYYTLIKNTVANVNHTTLKTFSLNLGYNGCTNGAQLIRDNEAKYHFNIPWTIAFYMDDSKESVTAADIADTVGQGIDLGIYTYLIFFLRYGCRKNDTAVQRLPRLRIHSSGPAERPWQRQDRAAQRLPEPNGLRFDRFG